MHSLVRCTYYTLLYAVFGESMPCSNFPQATSSIAAGRAEQSERVALCPHSDMRLLQESLSVPVQRRPNAWLLRCASISVGITDPVSPHIVGVLERHPQASANSCRQRERMLPAQFQRLEHDNLAGEMRHRQQVRKQAKLVQRRVVYTICAVDADHAGHRGIHAKQARSEWCHLVGRRSGRLILFGGGLCWDELRDGVWRDSGRVGDKEPIVNTAGVV